MFRIIRNKTPFVIVFFSLILAVCTYFEFYKDWFVYLPDLLGYSIFTNIFMFSVYMNKKYCTGTRVAVVSLIVMNVLNIFYLMFKLNGSLYDIFILILSILIIVVIKII